MQSRAATVAEYLGSLPAELKAAFRAAGKKIDMGKSCVRFKRVDDLSLDVIGKVIASVPVERYLAGYERARPK